MGKPAARITDNTAHGPPLTPGPGSATVIIGMKPAWRAVPTGAGAGLQAAQTAADIAIKAAIAATAAAAGPALPIAKAAEQTLKGAMLASVGALATGLSKIPSAFGGMPDQHICPIPSPLPPHGPGVVIDGSPTVMVDGLPLARMGDTVLEAIGGPDKIAIGEPTVMVG